MHKIQTTLNCDGITNTRASSLAHRITRSSGKSKNCCTFKVVTSMCFSKTTAQDERSCGVAHVHGRERQISAKSQWQRSCALPQAPLWRSMRSAVWYLLCCECPPATAPGGWSSHALSLGTASKTCCCTVSTGPIQTNTSFGSPECPCMKTQAGQ